MTYLTTQNGVLTTTTLPTGYLGTIDSLLSSFDKKAGNVCVRLTNSLMDRIVTEQFKGSAEAHKALYQALVDADLLIIE